jgi:hypothetical protein
VVALYCGCSFLYATLLKKTGQMSLSNYYSALAACLKATKSVVAFRYFIAGGFYLHLFYCLVQALTRK